MLDRLILTPIEPTQGEKIALGKRKGYFTSVQGSGIRPVIPTDPIKGPTHGKQKSIFGTLKGENFELFK